MNPWILSASVLLLGLVACLVLVVRGSLLQQLIALEMSGIIGVLILLLLAQGFDRPGLYDLALTMAFVSVPGIILFTHFLQEWLL